MKARIYDSVVLTVDVPGDFSDEIIPAGTTGAVVEAYDQPAEGYLVDVNIPDDASSTGFRYDNVLLYPDQFDVVTRDPRA